MSFALHIVLHNVAFPYGAGDDGKCCHAHTDGQKTWSGTLVELEEYMHGTREGPSARDEATES
jgi:hypothetical protein